MKAKIIILISFCVFFIGCSKKNNSQNPKDVQKEETLIINSSNNEIVISDSTENIIIKGNNNQVSTENSKDNENKKVDNSELYNHHQEDPNYWTLEKQKEIYETLFEKQDLMEAVDFRNFIESLAKYHHNDPLYEYNPVFLCYEKYPENLNFFLENKKELFLFGNMNWGDYSESPFLYVVENKTIDDVKFYFDNEIPVLESKDNLIYGSRNAGGPRFGIGGNILLYAHNEEIRNYLISKGIPTEIDAISYFEYYLKEEKTSIYENPGYDNKVLAEISKDNHFTALKVLAYKVNDVKWMKIKFDEGEGWIPESSFYYDTGI